MSLGHNELTQRCHIVSLGHNELTQRCHIGSLGHNELTQRCHIVSSGRNELTQWCHMVSLGHNELTQISLLCSPAGSLIGAESSQIEDADTWGAGHIYIRDVNLVITVPADGLAPNGARPSAGKVLMTIMICFLPSFDDQHRFHIDQIMSLNGWWDLAKSGGTSRVENGGSV